MLTKPRNDEEPDHPIAMKWVDKAPKKGEKKEAAEVAPKKVEKKEPAAEEKKEAAGPPAEVAGKK